MPLPASLEFAPAMIAAHQGPDFGAWMEAYGPILRRYFRRRVRAEDVDDLVQDVFVRIQAAQSDAPVENVESYLFATAHNVLANRYRDQAARAALLHDEWIEDIDATDPLSPERIAIAQEEYQRVIAAICNLPPRTREAFQLHRFDNLTYLAIAKRMGITRDSVKDLMHRALVRLAEEMETGQ